MIKNKLKIHQQLLIRIISDKPLLKVVSTFLCLKALHPSSVIFSISSIKKALAQDCFISKRTLDTRISALKKLNLVQIKGDRLYLSSYEDLYKSLDIVIDTSKCYYQEITCNPEYLLRRMAGKDNLFRQEQKIDLKIQKRNEGSEPNLAWIKQHEYDRFLECFEKREEYSGYFNPDITMSQSQIATMYGLDGQTRGYYWTKRLCKLGLMTAEHRIIQVQRKPLKKKITAIKGGVLWHPVGSKTDVLQIRNLVKF